MAEVRWVPLEHALLQPTELCVKVARDGEGRVRLEHGRQVADIRTLQRSCGEK